MNLKERFVHQYLNASPFNNFILCSLFLGKYMTEKHKIISVTQANYLNILQIWTTFTNRESNSNK